MVNLHVHSCYSLLDSIIKVDDIPKYAKDNGQKAIALTDHGYMYSYVNFVKACVKNGIKPITGCEIYECDDPNFKNDTKEYTQPRYHLVLLAKNKTGLLNLFKIVSEGCTTGFYKKPRVSLDWIKENNLGCGIICLTACMAGRLSKLISNNKYEHAELFYKKLSNIFDYVCIEMQSHSTEEQLELNKKLFEFVKKNNLPYCFSSDAHMMTSEQLNTHSVFVEIGEGREVGESYTDCYLQNDQDVSRILGGIFSKSEIEKGIKETENIADMIGDIDYEIGGTYHMPNIPIPHNFKTNKDYLHYLVFKTFDEKFGKFTEEKKTIYRDRLENELSVLNELDFTNYVIMQYMTANEADKRGLPRGYSRGSAGGCLCFYMLGVTQIDSVRWDLDFARFANLGRKGSVPDVDWDISRRRRQEIIDISEELFGSDKVCPIATFNTLSTKVAIKDIGKALNENPNSPYYNQIPYSVRDEVAKAVPTVKTLSDLGEEVENDILLKELIGKNKSIDFVCEKFPLWVKYVCELEGLPKSRGRHASATLITPKPIIEYMPLCLDNDKNIIGQLEMHQAQDDLMLVKQDYLGLRNLDIIDDTLKICGLTWEDVNINTLNLNDENVFKNIYANALTNGVFQFESAEAKKMCKEANVDSIEDIIAINAANRPATKALFPEYCKNKLYPESISVIHKDLKEIFKKTHCVLLYQEDALHLFAYAGFEEAERDVARRAIGKKKADVMITLKQKFIDGLTKKGWSEEQYNEMWELILQQASYSFNASHACSYGLLSYLTAYLKYYYPTAFFTALLSSETNNPEKIASIIADCKHFGVEVVPPHINKSGVDYTADLKNNKILFGLAGIKGLGEATINDICEARPFSSFDDYLSKIQDRTGTISLIKAGAFPCSSKVSLMKRYAKSLYRAREYNEVSSLPTKVKLLTEWGIDTEEYKSGKKINKELVLEIYNNKRKDKFLLEEQERQKKFFDDFKEKYASDEYLWEFQSLNTFLTVNPLEDAYEILNTQWDDVKDNEKAVVPCVIVNIKRKKDKHNNPFAYLDLCINNKIIEATIWSRQLNEYSEYIQKGNCVCILGNKSENHLFVERIKSYNQWIKDRKEKLCNGKTK